MFVCLFIPANFCCLLSYKRTNGLQIIKALDRLTASGNEFSGPMGYHLSKVDDIELNTDFETLPVGEDLFRYRRSAPSGLDAQGSENVIITGKSCEMWHTSCIPAGNSMVRALSCKVAHHCLESGIHVDQKSRTRLGVR